VRAALALFEERVADGLTEISAELRRMLEWLEHDRPRHWRTEHRRATDKAHDAQQALHRCLMFPIGDDRPSCYEERMELKKAQARLAYCEEKMERVQHWQRAVQHELYEYEGRVSQLARLAEADVPQAMAVLTRIVRQLEEYQALRATRPREAYNDESFTKEIWPESPPASTEADAKTSEPAPGESEATEPSGIETGDRHDAKM
jgi:hypothetical protein